jgi:hypothetical protein
MEKNNTSNKKIIMLKVEILKVSRDGSNIIAGKGKQNPKISLVEKGNKITRVDAEKSGSRVMVSKENKESGENW